MSLDPSAGPASSWARVAAGRAARARQARVANLRCLLCSAVLAHRLYTFYALCILEQATKHCVTAWRA